MVVKILAGNRILRTFLPLLCCLLCVAGDETVKLQEVEGTTVTLHTGITGIQSGAQILWSYGPEKAEEIILNSKVERFEERLQLDRISGALTTRNISRNDSGVYLLQILTGRLSYRTFRVSVYAPVSTPVINQREKQSVPSTETCLLLCTVENGKDVTLSWYRENEKICNTSNTDLSVPLNLKLQIQLQDINTNTYICVSENPVSNKTTSFKAENSGPPGRSYLVPVLISAGVFVLLIILITLWFWFKKKKQQVSEQSDELTYADVNITAHNTERVKEEENSRITHIEEEGDPVVYSNVKRCR